VIRPVILFPTDWASWEESELRAVIAHEASHIARHDALAQHFSLLHRAIFWFSPLGWWLHRSLVELAEAASDEAALASGADQIRYAETLLGFFAELEAADGRIWWQGVSMAKLGHAERRVDHILSWKGSSTMNRTRFAVIAVAAIALPVVVVTAAVRPSVIPVSDGTIWQSAQKAPSTPAAPGNPHEPSAPSGEEAPPALPPPAVSAPKIPPPPQSRVIVIPPMPVVRPMPSLPRVITIPDMAELKTLSALSSKQLMIMANRMAQQQGQDASSDVQYYFLSDQNGPNYMISADNLGIVASGSNISISTDGKSEYDDLLRSRRVKIGGDFIQFERDGKSYIIRDPATISRAKQVLAPLEALSKQQEELGKQQEELGKKQEALGKQMEEVRVKIPDITVDIEALKAKANALSNNGGTQEDLDDLQSQIGDLQSRIGEMQSQAGIEQSKIGRQQGELGRQQGAVGRKQGEIGRQQGELSEKVTREMQSLFDEALSKGTAKPE